MKKAISRVYGNQITILPANIRKEILVEDFDGKNISRIVNMT